MARTLQEIAGKNGHRIKTFDNTTRVAIGLDDSERHLYFYRDEGNYGLREHVDLSELRSCRVLKESSGSNGAVQADIEKLVLIFSLTDSSASTKSFLFYDSDKDWQLNGEVAISEKWNSLINSRLKKKNKF